MLADAVQQTNSLQLIALCSRGTSSLIRAQISNLRQNLVACVPDTGSRGPGNHDFRVGADAVTSALRRRRIEVLRNQHVYNAFWRRVLYVAGVR